MVLVLVARTLLKHWLCIAKYGIVYFQSLNILWTHVLICCLICATGFSKHCQALLELEIDCAIADHITLISTIINVKFDRR